MRNVNVVRAWKDEAYRSSLSADERAMLPANPAGAIELSDVEVGLIAGGVAKPVPQPGSTQLCTMRTMICCIYNTHC